MDPAVKAAQELTGFFQKLEIPCEVKVGADCGKFVTATQDLPEPGVTLVEEQPIVSWPTRSFLAMRLPFCFHCLRRDRSGRNGDTSAAPAACEEEGAAPSSASPALVSTATWSDCGLCQSKFCSDACRNASRRMHLLLCSALTSLRDLDSTTERCSSSGNHNSGGDADSARTDGTCRGERTTGSCTEEASRGDVEGSITPESVARCAAWLLTRLAASIEQSRLTSADFADAALLRRVFATAAAPFDRLIGVPDHADFAGIRDPQMWFAAIRTALRERAVKLLSLAANGPAAGAPAAAAEPWARELAEATLSDDTLRTFLGQLVLNAHAVNDYVFLDECGSEEANCRETEKTVSGGAAEAAKEKMEATETMTAPASISADVTNTAQSHLAVRFAWIAKGAAVYSLLSAFNHSCEPNVAVTCVDGTHEIAIKTTKPIKKGEEFHNTYIPLREGSTAKERREQLQGYFFTCQCPRCAAEDKANDSKK